MGGAPVIEAVRPGVQLAPAAAASFRRLEARLGRPADVNRTYADYNTQMRMYLAWQAYVTGNGPHPGHSRALHPDQSMHCRGLAWDTDDWRTPGFITLAAEYGRSEEHTSELQSLMRISYAVFCLKKKKNKNRRDASSRVLER